MNGSEDLLLFLGDMTDPWVESIAASLTPPWRVERWDCPNALPHCPFDPSRPPRAIILHRHRLTALEGERLRGWRDGSNNAIPEPLGAGDPIAARLESRPQIILCTSPYLRYEDLDRWSGMFDQVVSEATASEILPLRLSRSPGRRRPRADRLDTGLRIEVLGRDLELRELLRDACVGAGYRARAVDDRAEEIASRKFDAAYSEHEAERVLTIWELPILEQGWAERLETRQRRVGPVIAVVGFPSRETVATARSNGACGCLELPCEVDDLLDLVERNVSTWRSKVRFDHSHDLPRPAHEREDLRSAPRNLPGPTWSEPLRSSTISRVR